MPNPFDDIFLPASPADPTEAAKRAMRPLRKRFYTDVSVRETAAGFAIELDSRPVRTPARETLALPNGALAETVAAEWRAQGETIDPAKMPLTRLANVVIDAVGAAADEIAEDVARYLGSDLLVYRADGPERLVARQHAQWDPVLDWARDAHGARFILAEGVVFASQPDTAIAAIRALIPKNPWRLAAVHVITTLTGSALLALALAEGAIGLDAAWSAAHLDEDWNMELWGADALALERRAFRRAEMDAAATVLSQVGESL
ncbi:hypothetical protein A33M_2096 [Rhodovulum sp. PH10]|uniref:ATP12 family chaperone protein n=1 Tax=Rhodovulum sp. PH10 TaxID=1187851 RepID=UPI00027C1FF3|nr:ATP12 family protein [Rhodovulum sp. PH10]EJW12405.1 hypothetical protein A33M_2096 [Rhodovulum sp. PH10]